MPFGRQDLNDCVSKEKSKTMDIVDVVSIKHLAVSKHFLAT